MIIETLCKKKENLSKPRKCKAKTDNIIAAIILSSGLNCLNNWPIEEAAKPINMNTRITPAEKNTVLNINFFLNLLFKDLSFLNSSIEIPAK